LHVHFDECDAVIEYRKHADPVLGVVCIIVLAVNTLTAVCDNILLNGNNYGELRLAELRGDFKSVMQKYLEERPSKYSA